MNVNIRITRTAVLSPFIIGTNCHFIQVAHYICTLDQCDIRGSFIMLKVAVKHCRAFMPLLFCQILVSLVLVTFLFIWQQICLHCNVCLPNLKSITLFLHEYPTKTAILIKNCI